MWCAVWLRDTAEEFVMSDVIRLSIAGLVWSNRVPDRVIA